MATLTIRNVPPEVVQALKKQAARNHRSMEQEIREILQSQVGDRASAMDQIMKSWATQARSPSPEEIDSWIEEGRP